MDAALDRFRLRVLDDPALRARLLAVDDERRFATTVVALAAVEGIDVDLATVQDEMRQARQRWLERWL